jgi:exonuclease III
MKKTRPSHFLLQETHLASKDKHRLKGKGWNKIVQANRVQKQEGIAVLTSDKGHFKPKLIRRDKEGDFILTKGTLHQDEMTIVNIYRPNVGTSSFIKQVLLI